MSSWQFRRWTSYVVLGHDGSEAIQSLCCSQEISKDFIIQIELPSARRGAQIACCSSVPLTWKTNWHAG